jgi:hypothetical protein
MDVKTALPIDRAVSRLDETRELFIVLKVRPGHSGRAQADGLTFSPAYPFLDAPKARLMARVEVAGLDKLECRQGEQGIQLFRYQVDDRGLSLCTQALTAQEVFDHAIRGEQGYRLLD